MNEGLIMKGSKFLSNTLSIYADKVIIIDKSLEIKVELNDKNINDYDKIVINGITFVKENKDE